MCSSVPHNSHRRLLMHRVLSPSLRYIGEEGEHCPLVGAVAVACPVDCLSTANSLAISSLGQIMDPLLVTFVQKVREQHERVLSLSPWWNDDDDGNDIKGLCVCAHCWANVLLHVLLLWCVLVYAQNNLSCMGWVVEA